MVQAQTEQSFLAFMSSMSQTVHPRPKAGGIMRCKDFMKRFVTVCIITTLLALSGCGNKNDDNVSVIGGADGPVK